MVYKKKHDCTFFPCLKIEDKQLSAGKNRDTRLAALDEKKRAREERARRVKQRVRITARCTTYMPRGYTKDTYVHVVDN